MPFPQSSRVCRFSPPPCFLLVPCLSLSVCIWACLSCCQSASRPESYSLINPSSTNTLALPFFARSFSLLMWHSAKANCLPHICDLDLAQSNVSCFADPHSLVSSVCLPDTSPVLAETSSLAFHNQPAL